MSLPWSKQPSVRATFAKRAGELAARVRGAHGGRLLASLRLGLIFLLLGMLIAIHASLMALYPYYRAAERYDITEVSHYRTGCAVVDSLGQPLGRIFASNLDPVSIDALPPHLVNALIATEDAKFFRHGGADLPAIVRAALINLRRSQISQGGSTITQQLARCVYQMDERSVERKLLELFLARRIEHHYSKTEILEQYLNRVYFGNGSWGIGAAARDYFGKSVQELTLEESALLVGIIKRPVGFSPYQNPAAAKQTRDRTLQRMEKLGYLTPEDSKHFRDIPLRLQSRTDRGNVPHYLLDHIEHDTRLILQQMNLPAEGYVIHTSADLAIQDQVHRALMEKMPEVEAKLQSSAPGGNRVREDGSASAADDLDLLQAAAVVIHHQTGRILASVGGRNYERSQFNRVFQAHRPPGSCFLPFVYAAVFHHPDLGPRAVALDTALDNRKVMIGGWTGVLGEWAAERHDTAYEGEIPAAYALLKSKNAATVRLGTRVGLDAVCALAQSAGLDSGLKRYPATFLGASEVSLLELTRAFSLFPLQGAKPPPASLVDFITKPDGTLVYERPQPAQTALISSTAASQICRVLQAGLYAAPDSPLPDSHGLCSLHLAGKSGTVHDYTDAWFVGFDGEVTCGVWVGYDQPKPLASEAFGSQLALPVWAEIMNGLAADSPLPATEEFDAHGPLFCRFPLQDSTATEQCQCLLHRPNAAAGIVSRTETWRPPAELPQPIRPQVPVLTGDDPYHSAWPASPKPVEAQIR